MPLDKSKGPHDSRCCAITSHYVLTRHTTLAPYSQSHTCDTPSHASSSQSQRPHPHKASYVGLMWGSQSVTLPWQSVEAVQRTFRRVGRRGSLLALEADHHGRRGHRSQNRLVHGSPPGTCGGAHALELFVHGGNAGALRKRGLHRPKRDFARSECLPKRASLRQIARLHAVRFG